MLFPHLFQDTIDKIIIMTVTVIALCVMVVTRFKRSSYGARWFSNLVAAVMVLACAISLGSFRLGIIAAIMLAYVLLVLPHHKSQPHWRR